MADHVPFVSANVSDPYDEFIDVCRHKVPLLADLEIRAQYYKKGSVVFGGYRIVDLGDSLG